MPHPHQANNLYHYQRKQHGAALMVMLVIMVMGAATFLVSSLSRSRLQTERDQKTSAALAQAKDALIGYAASVNLTTSARPGDLPCPDINNDGSADTPCSGNAIGRLPWKTLGLPDLRDGSGERLWYAVSAKFKNNPRTTCTNSNLTGCLNSDTEGTITVFGSDGSAVNTGNSSTGAVAVIIAPGDVLQRQDNVSQTRGCTVGVNCDATDKCTSASPTTVPKCNPVNYLDIATVGGITEDNANFVDGSATNGFIQGRVLNSSGQTIVNDRLLVITEYHIIPLLEKRVAAEVKNCLIEYAAIPHNQGPAPNQGYYPFATARTPGPPVSYNDSDRLLFGHVPDMPFAATCSDTGGSTCGSTGGMQDVWGPTCTLSYSNWWVNWKEMVFYGLANKLRPHNLTHTHACSDSPNPCLVVNPPSAAIDKHFVVIVAGEKLPGQVRTTDTDKSNLNNYLEGGNATGASPFEQRPPSATFNDTVVFQ